MVFSILPRLAARYALLSFAAALLAACTTVSLEDAAPGPRTTRTFPNLNVPMRAETEQFTEQETSRGVAELSAARARQEAESAQQMEAGGNAERLRRLGLSHGEETLRRIEEVPEEDEP